MAKKEKRYYWIRLGMDFFERDDISYLIHLENGASYVILFLQLCLLTANKSGRLAYIFNNKTIPYDAGKISCDTGFDIETVEKAMELFEEVGLIVEENGIFSIPYVDEAVGSECESTERVRKHRCNA